MVVHVHAVQEYCFVETLHAYIMNLHCKVASDLKQNVLQTVAFLDHIISNVHKNDEVKNENNHCCN